jgi:hypothetical protein
MSFGYLEMNLVGHRITSGKGKRRKKENGNLPEGRSPGKGDAVQAFFILARETNPFLSRKYM